MEHMEKVRPLLWRCFCKEFSDETWAHGFETLAQQVSNISLSQREGNGKGKDRIAIKKKAAQGIGIRQKYLKVQNWFLSTKKKKRKSV